MKNKIILIVLSVLILFSSTACSGSNISTKQAITSQATSAANKDDAVNKEKPDTEESEEDEPEKEEIEDKEDEEPTRRTDCEYVLSNSDTKKLTESDLAPLGDAELEIARNEIYARHGRKFKTEYLQEYFDHQSWYKGKIEPEDFDESVLSDIEKYNINLIVEYENERENSYNDNDDYYIYDYDSDNQYQQRPDIDYSPSSQAGNYNATKCYNCNGTGHCLNCLYGECISCNGRGSTMCSDCVGLGKCGKCAGDGYYYTGVGVSFRKVYCPTCNASGRCRRCNGYGNITCNTCYGSGDCIYCYGEHFCNYCGGTGYLY